MILLTRTQRAQLLANGRQRGADHVPVVKFFNPFGEGVWLATELDQAATSCSAWPISATRTRLVEHGRAARGPLPFGMGIERDLLFTGDFPISVWAEAARETGSIRAAERVLYRAGAAFTAHP